MSSIVAYIDRAFLTAVAGPAPAAKKARQIDIIIGTAAILPALLERFEINTAARIEPFLDHECDGSCTTREYASGAAYVGPQGSRQYPAGRWEAVSG